MVLELKELLQEKIGLVSRKIEVIYKIYEIKAKLEEIANEESSYRYGGVNAGGGLRLNAGGFQTTFVSR